MADLGISLHDFKVQALGNFSPLQDDQLDKMAFKIQDYLGDCNDEYYMLLSNERKDYTLFHFVKDKVSLLEVGRTVIECLQNRDLDILDYEVSSAGGFEIWVRDREADPSVFFYAFFPYDIGVIEF